MKYQRHAPRCNICDTPLVPGFDPFLGDIVECPVCDQGQPRPGHTLPGGVETIAFPECQDYAPLTEWQLNQITQQPINKDAEIIVHDDMEAVTIIYKGLHILMSGSYVRGTQAPNMVSAMADWIEKTRHEK